tara:strand:- start:1086 stop:1586 length:501 start_codon:yes stop_codon:yes gene_type:complete
MKFKKIFLVFIALMFTTSLVGAKPKSSGKFKDWQSFVADTEKGKICFAQSLPTERAPKKFKRNKSKLFVTFRPSEDIKNEVSVTSGHVYKNSSVSIKSGRNNYSLFSQGNFAWIADEKEELRFIKLMKKATSVMVTANETKGSQTVDHYSMMGFTKAYNTAKKNCS